MAWLRIDDTVPTHRKHLKAGPAASWLWVCGIAYCQRHLTDGFIPAEALPLLGVVKGAEALAEKLVSVGLFDKADGGYAVHDYLAMNDCREAAQAKRQSSHDDKSRAGRAGAAKRWQKDSSLPSAIDSRPDGETNGEAVAEGHGTTMAPPLPSPSLPSPVLSDPAAPTPRPARGAPPLRSDGVMAGALPRDHMGHAVCSPNFAWCVPSSVHGKLRTALLARFEGDVTAATAALSGWYREVWDSLPADTVIGDAFRFWQPRFDARWATATPAAPRGLNLNAIAAEVKRQNAEAAS